MQPPKRSESFRGPFGSRAARACAAWEDDEDVHGAAEDSDDVEADDFRFLLPFGGITVFLSYYCTTNKRKDTFEREVLWVMKQDSGLAMKASSWAARTIARWGPRWCILALLLIDAPLVHLALRGQGRDPSGVCFTKSEHNWFRLSLFVHLCVPLGFLAKWGVRQVLGLRRQDRLEALDAELSQRSVEPQHHWTGNTVAVAPNAGRNPGEIRIDHENVGYNSNDDQIRARLAHLDAEADRLRQQLAGSS